MKFIHLSDLHLGKRWNEYSLTEDQRYILGRILEIVDNVSPDGVIIAGDVYDKSNPSAEAVELFDEFLVGLCKRRQRVFVVSGNHDSAERIAFGGRIMSNSGVYMSPVYGGAVKPYTFSDKYGELNVYALPFIKPVNVKKAHPDREDDVSSYTDAIRVAIENMNVDVTARNVLITHQFITGASRSESEEISVGGSDNVDVEVFKDFDYVALGHIHKAQNVGSEKVRYCGTPLKYSFSEMNDKKSVTVVELKEKGELSVEVVPLEPLREVMEIKGKYDELTARSFYENKPFCNAYLRVVLTDEQDVLNAQGKLRSIYENVMELRYENQRTLRNESIEGAAADAEKQPLELCEELYRLQNNQAMSDTQRDYLKQIIENVWGEEK
ncbi:MAG: exonuclease SbcCD subunit D [Christensenellaceae bacterium]